MTVSTNTYKIVNCITNMLRAVVMQKKEGIKPTSGANEQVFEATPSRISENAFLICRTNTAFIQSYTKSYVIYSLI